MTNMRLAGGLAALASMGALAALEHDANACGGCFTPPVSENESVITDEKMLLSISMNQTTLYDQINYSGSPSSFAWVLPIKGAVTVGLSADVMFQVIGQITATGVQAPPTNCPPPPNCFGNTFAEGPGAGRGAAEDAGAAVGTVTVTSQKQVGPYETVQLHSNDGSALNNWLTSHGYNVPASTKPIIDAYVSQHFDFLALKLVPGRGVQSMQPVRVTSQGAAPSLPLHMVAIGTGPTTGITIWVVADGRWEPSNFPTFTIGASELVWDWATNSSNYESLRLSKEAKFGGRGWQIESSLELSQYTIQQSLLNNVEYGPPTGGYLPAPAAADAGADAATGDGGDNANDDAGEDDGGDETAAATADLAVLFHGVAQPNVRITRMRSDVAQSALSVDMKLEAGKDQSEMNNILVPQQQKGEPQCTLYNANTCAPEGTAPRSQAQAQAQAQAAASASASGGCSTTDPRTSNRSTAAFLLGLAGVVAFRVRQKRRSPR